MGNIRISNDAAIAGAQHLNASWAEHIREDLRGKFFPDAYKVIRAAVEAALIEKEREMVRLYGTGRN